MDTESVEFLEKAESLGERMRTPSENKKPKEKPLKVGDQVTLRGILYRVKSISKGQPRLKPISG